MAEYLTNDADLKKVADAIRAKGETSAKLVYPDGFVSAIQNISSSKPEQEKSVTITTNGLTEITPDTGKTLSKVTVRTNIELKTILLASNIAINDGILTFTVDKQVYGSDACDFMVVESTYNPRYKLFLWRLTDASDKYYAISSTSVGYSLGTNHVTYTSTSTQLEFVYNVSDSGGEFYEGTVNVYGWIN